MSDEERLPPERRFRLYSRLANIFHDYDMPDAERAARAIASQAAKESPLIQAEFRAFMERLKKAAREL